MSVDVQPGQRWRDRHRGDRVVVVERVVPERRRKFDPRNRQWIWADVEVVVCRNAARRLLRVERESFSARYALVLGSP